MKTSPLPVWTESASARLSAWLADRRASMNADDGDPDEITADLENHVREELAGCGSDVITREMLEPVLTRLGGAPPERAAPLPAAEMSAPVPDAPAWRPRVRHPWWILAGAVWLPLIAFGYEVITRGCAGLLFDPMPDLLHHALVLLVPLAGWLFWRWERRERPRAWRGLGWLTGAALAISCFYALLFLPLAPFSVLGIVWFGIGLLSLSPIFAFIACWRIAVWHGRIWRHTGGAGKPVRTAFWLTVIALGILESRGFMTRIGIDRAARAGTDAARMADAVQIIRRYGSEAALHRACYDYGGDMDFGKVAPDPASWVSRLFRLRTGLEDWRGNEGMTLARDLYFRVTGTPFNLADPPRAWGSMAGAAWDRRRIDDLRGGNRVAGRIPGLSLQGGRIDWHCEAASGLTWGEWTFEFANSGTVAQEARCRMALPPGGFVSRLTLWVNGEPQEAAWSRTENVRAAYRKVAVVERRDPVLVTQPEEGAIQLQAFPVPAGGRLKCRVTFTVPAGPDGMVWLPAITEQNFEWAGAPVHCWVQADAGTLTGPAEVRTQTAEEAGHPTFTCSLMPESLSGSGCGFRWQAERAPVVWSGDPFAGDPPQIVVRTGAPETTLPVTRVAWVVDGSVALRPFRPAIPAALESFAPGASARVFVPGDAPAQLWQGDPADWPAAPAFAGGRDNAPALAAAVDWLRGGPDGVLVWLHGPQPVSPDSTASVDQLLTRSAVGFALLDVPLVPGENALSGVFSRRPRVPVLSVRGAADGLGEALARARRLRTDSWQRLPAGTPPPVGAVQVSDTLARQWAWQESRRLSLTDRGEAGKLAAAHQVVTLDSGAVVLERASDYAASGLTQSATGVAQLVPVIPEPSSAVLSLAGTAFLLLRRRRG